MQMIVFSHIISYFSGSFFSLYPYRLLAVAIQLHFCNQTAMWPDNVQLLTWPEQTDKWGV